MKKLLLLSALMCSISTATFAGEVSPYIEGRVTHNWMKADYSETGFDKDFSDALLGGSVAFGLKMNNNFRVELEGYYNHKMEDTYLVIPLELETRGFFVNAYYDFDLTATKAIRPYVGAGIGCAWMEEKARLGGLGYHDRKEKDEDVSFNIGLGMAYELEQNVDMTLGYRYEYLGKIKVNGSDTKVQNNKVALGFRFGF